MINTHYNRQINLFNYISLLFTMYGVDSSVAGMLKFIILVTCITMFVAGMFFASLVYVNL